MLRLRKETLAELTPDELSVVLGAAKVPESCIMTSCLTTPVEAQIKTTTTTFITFTDAC